MKAAEIVEQMKGLVPDSMDELQYFDPEGNRNVYVSKEKSTAGDYYVFRFGSLNVYAFADKVAYLTGVGGEEILNLFNSEILTGIIFVNAWRVRGE